MDIFIEQIVKKRISPKDILMIVGLSLVGVVLVVASILFIPQFAIFVVAAAGFGMYQFIALRNLEFEYSVTNGDFTCDKIINRSRRKRVLSFDLKGVEAMSEYDAAKQQHRTYDKRLFVGEFEDGSGGQWCMELRTPELGHVLLVFSPEENILKAIRPFLPRQVAVEAFGKKR